MTFPQTKSAIHFLTIFVNACKSQTDQCMVKMKYRGITFKEYLISVFNCFFVTMTKQAEQEVGCHRFIHNLPASLFGIYKLVFV